MTMGGAIEYSTIIYFVAATGHIVKWPDHSTAIDPIERVFTGTSHS